MPLITLTTDYGMKDFYVSVLKAHLIKFFPNHTVADISHLVTPFNIMEGSVVFKSSWHHFPKQTIHLVDIDPFGGQLHFLAFEYQEHFFLLPDNGMISLIFENTDAISVYKIDLDQSHKSAFNLYGLFIKAIQQMQNQFQGQTPFHEYMQSMSFQPVFTADTIHANVIYIDHYRNAILNVNQTLFEKIRKERKFELVWKKFSISTLHHGIHDVAENEIACYFNSAGLLTIGLNKSRAAELLGLNLHSEVLIDFLN